jgi:two-component system, cell cycle response regulator
MARGVAIAAAVLVLFIVPVYHLVDWLRFEIPVDLLRVHALWRAVAVTMAVITLVGCLWQRESRGAPILLFGLALSVMTMMFGLLATDLTSLDGDPGRMVHGLIMATFAVSLISLRGWQELALVFTIPLAGTLIGLNQAGADMLAATNLLIEPLLMLGVGLIASEILRRTRLQTFVAHQELQQLASTDPLTGLNNRRSIEPQLESEVSRARRHHAHLSVLIADLDHFKRVNDQYGHVVGDGMLCEVARRIETLLRKEDRAARWGGEEFLVLLPETDLEQAEIVAEKIREAIASRPVAVNGFRIPLTISIGVAAWADDADAESLIRRADKGLYRAKGSGRNRVCSEPVFEGPNRVEPLKLA